MRPEDNPDIPFAFRLNRTYATSIEGDIAKAMLAALWEAHDDNEPKEKPQRQHTSAEAIVKRQAEVRRLISLGRTRQQVATHMGISYHSVRNDFNALLKAGLVTKDQGKSTLIRQATAKKRRPKVAKLHTAGWSNAEIAKMIGASATTVSKDIIFLVKSGAMVKRGADII
jgi:DNA-binding NarL/FixJ family response regulator